MRLVRLGIVVGTALVLAGCGGATRRPATSAGDRPPVALGSDWRTDFARHSVPYSQFQAGGPGKDGIPALDHPRFVPARRADSFLQPHEPIVELSVSGSVRGYPIEILIWHEIVNDRVGGVPVAVTFCPLCNTSIVFDRRVDGRTLSFGTTGNLRNSDLVMYDRQTESWWQQFGGEGLVGRYTGARLRELPSRIVAWQEFKRAHPRAPVLSRKTGYDRLYGQNPYVGYDDVRSPPFFPAAHSGDRRLQPKARVVFVERGGESVAVAIAALRHGPVRIVVGGHRLVVRARGKVSSPLDTQGLAAGRYVFPAEVTENGKLVPFDEPFWFAVAAFRPKVVVVRG